MKGAVAFVLLLTVSIAAAGGAFNCSVDLIANGKAYRYNLTSLFHEPQLSDNLYYMDQTGGLTYFNLCGDTTTICSPSSPVCKRSGLWSTMGYGDLSTQQMHVIDLSGYSADQGVTVEYSNGEYCPNSPGTSSKIHVVCGKDEAFTSLSVMSDGCSIVATIKSAAGCPEILPYTDGGEVFAIVVLVLLLVGVIAYIAIGMFLNKRKGAQTVPEMIPHREFWLSLPLMIRDGVMFIAHGFKKGDYVSV